MKVYVLTLKYGNNEDTSVLGVWMHKSAAIAEAKRIETKQEQYLARGDRGPPAFGRLVWVSQPNNCRPLLQVEKHTLKEEL